MNVTTTPAAARTDLTSPLAGTDAGKGTDTATGKGTGTATAPTDATTRRLGLALAGGAATYSAASFALGFTPESSIGVAITDLAGLTFQLGVMALVALQLRTRATGVSRGAVRMLKVERVLLGIAMLWSLIHGLVPAARDDAWLVALDVFWPLSMLGMFVIGIKIALAGRWRGAARVWPLVAESWAVVSIPAIGIFGPEVGGLVGASHFLVGYVALGLILAARPDLTRR